MNNENNWNIPRWYVIHTNPKQEDRAELNLRAWQVETFNPRFRSCRYNEYTGEPIYTVKPFFPRYIFARFKVEDLFHKVRFTRGVSEIVTFGDYPSAIDDDIINIIKSQIGDDGLVRIGEKLRPGDRVMLNNGPLKNFTGIFKWEMKDASRVMILLETVSYQARVVVNKQLLRRLG
jgi:transcriptional antiterminator RfaH